MHHADHDIYASAPLRQLVQTQTRALLPSLQRCVGEHALLIDACGEDAPPALPLLGCWIRLCIDAADGYRGDLRASASEPLPFVADAFDLLLLRHALEASPDSAALLSESVRVLASGGTLVITGVHPFSCWSPWLYWRGRDAPRRLQMPVRLAQRLRHFGLDLEFLRRVGSVLPRVSRLPESLPDSALGGGYVLVARKQRRSCTPLRSRPLPLRVATSNQLSPGAPRSPVLSRSKERYFQ